MPLYSANAWVVASLPFEDNGGNIMSVLSDMLSWRNTAFHSSPRSAVSLSTLINCSAPTSLSFTINE